MVTHEFTEGFDEEREEERRKRAALSHASGLFNPAGELAVDVECAGGRVVERSDCMEYGLRKAHFPQDRISVAPAHSVKGFLKVEEG